MGLGCCAILCLAQDIPEIAKQPTAFLSNHETIKRGECFLHFHMVIPTAKDDRK